jgi:ATP-dependent Lon protease
LAENVPDIKDKKFKTLIETLRNATKQYIQADEDIPREGEVALGNISNPVMLVNFICVNMPFSIKEKIEMLSVSSLEDRIYSILKIEDRDRQLLNIKSKINQKTHQDIDEQQKEYFLQQQLKNIKDELGSNGNQEWDELIKRPALRNGLRKCKRPSRKKLTNLNP